MRIGEAARLADTSVRALRHYEDEGLISPDRGPNGYRDFSADTVAAARIVRVLVGQGLPTRIVREVLPYLCGSDAIVPGPPCDYLIDALTEQRDTLDRRIAALTDNRDALDGYLTSVRTAWRADA